MKYLISIFTLYLLLSCNQQNDDVRTETIKQIGIEELMVSYENCKENANSRNECKHFIAQSICEYNGISDFINESGNYVDYHSIYDLILEDDKWKNMGSASEQNVLTDAQTLANEGLPVIAINKATNISSLF